jgi:hypothetical protein
MIVLLMIGGCAGSLGTIHNNPSPPPVTSFDGSYRSTIRSTRPFAGQMNTWCDSPGQPIITVENGQFTYTVPHPNLSVGLVTAFPATIAQDGSFHGEIRLPFGAAYAAITLATSTGDCRTSVS